MSVLDMELDSEEIFESDRCGNELICEIKCPRFNCCKGQTYNKGFAKCLCPNPYLCATENPKVSMHPEDKEGTRFKWYKNQIQDNHDYA